MIIMICGSVGSTGASKILKMTKFLERNGYQIIKQFDNGDRNYYHIHDFRSRKELSKKIVRHDIALIKKSDVVIILPEPSFGASIEMFLAKIKKKKVILYSDRPMPSPWPIAFSDRIVKSRKALIELLQQIS